MVLLGRSLAVARGIDTHYGPAELPTAFHATCGVGARPAASPWPVRHLRSLGCPGACAAARPLDPRGARHRALAARVPERQRARARRTTAAAEIPCPLGLLIPAAALLALVPLGAASRGLFDEPAALDVAGLSLVLGVARARPRRRRATPAQSRGWRGHGAALLRGGFNTGVLKAVGTLGLALAWSAITQPDDARFLLAAAVIVLATNVFNLLDLRPGPLGQGVRAARRGADARRAGTPSRCCDLGLWCGPDPRRRRCSTCASAACSATPAATSSAPSPGLWLVLVLDTTGLAIALAALVLITVYGELRSINALVERTPGLRHLDSLGRPHRA